MISSEGPWDRESPCPRQPWLNGIDPALASRIVLAARASSGGMTLNESDKRYTGGCLCALRYEAEGEPLFAGLCCCADCQKASGSAFVPFMGFASPAVRFRGATRMFASRVANRGDAVRNSCPVCESLVFGDEVGKDDLFTVYAGSLDDPSSFHPEIVIFARSRPRLGGHSAGPRDRRRDAAGVDGGRASGRPRAGGVRYPHCGFRER